MEHFVVSALKYRPKAFDEVVGQEAITHTLENAIHSNQLAQALLFCGPRGVGKTTCARIVARQVNAFEQKEPEVTSDYSFNIFELDAASNNSVDDIRALTDQVRIPPQVGSYKVYIIDEVHMLSTAAFNAFLKTLEEPPKHAIFILATTEKHKILPTILSRCQVYDFKRISISDTVHHLNQIAIDQGVKAEEQALYHIAKKSDGALRDALSLFDRLVSFSKGTLSMEVLSEQLNELDYIKESNTSALLLHFDELLQKGYDGLHFLQGLSAHFRDLLVAQSSDTAKLLNASTVFKERYAQEAKTLEKNVLLAAIELIGTHSLSYKSSENQRLVVELCLLQLASLEEGLSKKKSLI
jgi:DNA polymerase III subunit gamma/tau